MKVDAKDTNQKCAQFTLNVLVRSSDEINRGEAALSKDFLKEPLPLFFSPAYLRSPEKLLLFHCRPLSPLGALRVHGFRFQQ